jgi:hypothetical protein
MEMTWFSFFMLVLAAENLADMLTTLDLFATPRRLFQEGCSKLRIPEMGKLAECRFCQVFWICLALLLLGLPSLPIACLAAHRACQFLSEFSERYFNRWPVTVSATVQSVQDDGKEIGK